MLKVFILVSCLTFYVNCLNYESDNCNGCKNEYVRIKRAKYFSSSPFKIYNRPPFSPSIRGPFSYTPPPGYMANDVGPPIPSKSRPYKVSKRPSNDGLGEEDLINLFKYLSKKDLDKIVEFASEKGTYRESNEKNTNQYELDFNSNDNLPDKTQTNRWNSDKILNENRYYKSDNDNPNLNHPTDNQFTGPLKNYETYQKGLLDTNDYKEEELSFLNSDIQKEIGIMSQDKNIYTDSRTIPEEELPRPTNLRNYDHEISFTNDVASVVKPDSYELENFADLPLMNYINSKLHTVNSYSVPHYSITSLKRRPTKSSSFMSSSSFHSDPSNQNTVKVEPAPPASVAKSQSDAHLKAIKIWTHQSQGTAYTLHDDGTLTLEQPSRVQFNHN